MGTSETGVDILKDGLDLSSRIFPITNPNVSSGQVYYFTTHSGLLYEVRFGKKSDNYFGHVVNFGVRHEDYDHEYATTNKGEIYAIIPTVMEIICRFQNQNPHNNYYEFTGEFKDRRDDQEASIRTRFYLRTAKRYINTAVWGIELQTNKVILRRKPK